MRLKITRFAFAAVAFIFVFFAPLALLTILDAPFFLFMAVGGIWGYFVTTPYANGLAKWISEGEDFD